MTETTPATLTDPATKLTYTRQPCGHIDRIDSWGQTVQVADDSPLAGRLVTTGPATVYTMGSTAVFLAGSARAMAQRVRDGKPAGDVAGMLSDLAELIEVAAAQ